MLDPVLLQTFLSIAEGASFSEAGRKLGLSQSSVSDHVRKLEKSVGHQLLVRDTHSVSMTPQGEALIEFARIILETNERARRHFAASKIRGRLRFGASEDLVASWLPEILRAFTADHPLIDLEFTIALSNSLVAKFDAGELDVVLCKRWPGADRGELIWRDPLVWCAAERVPDFPDGRVPLILYPPPSITRFMALAALEQAGTPWRLACTSGSLSGLAAAARARLGLMAHSRMFIPEGLMECAPHPLLPKFDDLEFILLSAKGRLREPIQWLTDAILAKARSTARFLPEPAKRV